MDIVLRSPTQPERLLHDALTETCSETLPALLSAVCDTIFTTSFLSKKSLISSLDALEIQEFRFRLALTNIDFEWKFTQKEQYIIQDASNKQYAEDDIEGAFYTHGGYSGIVALILFFRRSGRIQKHWAAIIKECRGWLVRRVMKMLRRDIVEWIPMFLSAQGPQCQHELQYLGRHAGRKRKRQASETRDNSGVAQARSPSPSNLRDTSTTVLQQFQRRQNAHQIRRSSASSPRNYPHSPSCLAPTPEYQHHRQVSNSPSVQDGAQCLQSLQSHQHTPLISNVSPLEQDLSLADQRHATGSAVPGDSSTLSQTHHIRSCPSSGAVLGSPGPVTVSPGATLNPGATVSPAVTVSPGATPNLGATVSPGAEPSQTERTAFKLAKQLRNFQGCTHEQHRKADRLHQEHHRRPDVHSQCSSLHEITTVLRGNYGVTRLPDVLRSSKLMKPTDFSGLDCQAAFEGTSPSAAPEDIATCDENLPMNLCLSQHYTASRKNRRPTTSFDIDSTCCFPTSLAVARQGINWFPKVHPFLNLTADIHFGLSVPFYNKYGVLTQKHTPLHKIPHYCFGSVIGIDGLLMFVFFPALYVESDDEHSTYLSKQDQELWYDAILAPAIHETVRSSNILQHFPATARIADIDSTALSKESLARKHSSREVLLKHVLQPQYLDSLWSQILKTITENPGCSRFQGASLFIHSKNTKLESMAIDGGLNTAYERWATSWSHATDSQFYNKDRTFVDLAKQTTSEDSALPYDQIPAGHEAEVFLWRKCCLDAYVKTRTVLNPDGSVAKGNPKCTAYPWATMRDTKGQTLFAAPHRKESQDGLIYSQFYALIKTPFDTTKVYVFDNESLENLALDPGYVRSLQQEGGGITFSKAVCEFSYLHSKRRACANLVDNQWKSYGIREEHRISLTMMEEIAEQWHQWDLYDEEIEGSPSPLPYYIVPTKELLGFLYAQINKYCFLFEHVLAHTAMTYSLPETIVMVTVLRALRFCYGSNLIQRESLLYKDCWESQRNDQLVVKEGLGMQGMIERCGLGWFLPKINWATWRFKSPHGDNILVGNMLMHEEYKRRWQAVKDLRDVYVRFSQAESWHDRYDIQNSAPLLSKWLEYLHILILDQFDADIWKAMLKSHNRSPELTLDAIKQKGHFQFCYSQMKRMFSIDGAITHPHFVTGNKMRFERVADLLDFLFLWEDGKERRGWGNKPYRAILQKSFELVERRLGHGRANRWLNEFFQLVRLTHWVLPYPSESTFIMSTKTNRNQGLKGRMMWFSAVYANPAKVEVPFRSYPLTLFHILRDAQQQTFDDSRHQNVWGTSQLITACKAQGIKMYGQKEFWVVGKKSNGLKGFVPIWEQRQPPKLEMLERTKNKSLDELEDMFSGFSREYANDNFQDNGFDVSSDELGLDDIVDELSTSDSCQSRSLSTSRRVNNKRRRESELDESVTAMTVTSSSVFVPSVSEGSVRSRR